MAEKKELAYEYIKHKIIIGELPAQADISEKQLSEELNISRTPIHEALARLEDEDFVRRYPQKGTFVTEVTPERIRAVYEARLLIEPSITRQCIGLVNRIWLLDMENRLMNIPKGLTETEEKYYLMDLDTEFHATIASCCQNHFLRAAMKSVYDHDQRIRRCTFKSDKQIHHSQKEHLQIIQAILNGDADSAERLAANHIQRSREMTFVSLGFVPEI